MIVILLRQRHKGYMRVNVKVDINVLKYNDCLNEH